MTKRKLSEAKKAPGASARELRAFVDHFPEPPKGLDHVDPYGRDLRTHWANFLDECLARDPERSARSVYNALKNHQMLIYLAWVAGLDIVDVYYQYYEPPGLEQNRLVSLVRAALPWEAVQAGLTRAAADGEFTLFELSCEEGD